MYIKIESLNIHYSDFGKGDVVVLLHGFMESSFMWKSLTKRLSYNFRVISFDLPGHGKSEKLKKDISIDRMAEIIVLAINKLNLEKVQIVGHSMGGYIALSIVERFTALVKSFVMLHSKAGEDSLEAKEKRLVAIAMLKQHPHMVIKESITNLFREATRKNYLKEIESFINVAKSASFESYGDAQFAMINRPNRIKQLKNSIPKLYIYGKYDPIIPYELSLFEIDHLKNGETLLLNHSGHMGFIEEKALCEKEIEMFLLKHQ